MKIFIIIHTFINGYFSLLYKYLHVQRYFGMCSIFFLTNICVQSKIENTAIDAGKVNEVIFTEKKNILRI